MDIKSYVIYFLTGGIVTTIIVALEQSDQRIASGFATLMPVFTLVSYIFIGESKGGLAVSQHSKFVLLGTIVSWVPYMLVVSWLSPTYGANKAITIGLLTFFVLAGIYLLAVSHFHLFK